MSTLVEVPISFIPTLRAGTPRAITPFPYLVTFPARSCDISPDVQRFVVATYDPPKDEPITGLQVIVNWFK